MTLLISSLVLIPFSVFVAVIPDKAMERWLSESEHVPESWIVDVPEGGPMLGLTYTLFEADDAPLRRNLYIVGKVLVAGSPTDATLVALQEGNPEEQERAFQEIRGLENLAGRDLRYANLSRSYLPKVNLKSTQLQRANLYGAQLQGANLSGAQLQGANFFTTQLQGADLYEAQLQGAKFSSAKLQGARLTRTDLQGAHLFGAQLHGAKLYGAQFQGANLSSAQLQGTDLFIANLQGANLSWAQLQGANLSGAQLQGANLYMANFQGANLFGVKLQGAILKYAKLSLAVLLKLGRGQFTKENYDALEKKLIKKNVDEQRIRKILKDVDALIGRADDLVFGPATHHALCDEVDPDRECLTLGQKEQFVKEWVEYIVSLACPDSYIAEGVARQVMPHQDARPTFKGELGEYIYRLQKLQASMLAKRLLSPDCKGGADLPDDVREKLQKLSRESGPNGVTKPSSNVSTP